MRNTLYGEEKKRTFATLYKRRTRVVSHKVLYLSGEERHEIKLTDHSGNAIIKRWNWVVKK